MLAGAFAKLANLAVNGPCPWGVIRAHKAIHPERWVERAVAQFLFVFRSVLRNFAIPISQKESEKKAKCVHIKHFLPAISNVGSH